MKNDIRKANRIKLTLEQAVALESAMLLYGKIDLVNMASDPIVGFNKKFSALNDLSAGEVAEAVYREYDIEQRFKKGDYVRDENGNIGKVIYADEARLGIRMISKNLSSFFVKRAKRTKGDFSSLRMNKASEQEVDIFKRSMSFFDADRNPWELKRGDILRGKHGRIYEVKTPNSNGGKIVFLIREHGKQLAFSIDFISDEFNVVCFVEDRRDIGKQGGNEENNEN